MIQRFFTKNNVFLFGMLLFCVCIITEYIIYGGGEGFSWMRVLVYNAGFGIGLALGTLAKDDR